MENEQQQGEPEILVTHAGQTRRVPLSAYGVTVEALIMATGQAWDPPASTVTVITPAAPGKAAANASTVVDRQAARDRVAQQHETLKAHGVNLDTLHTIDHDTTSGAARREKRRQEHMDKAPLADVTALLTDTIIAEKRINKVVSAADFGAGLSINGALKFDGYALREQAIRGLLLRLESPAGSYVFGVRDRLAMTAKERPTERALDKAIILDTIKRECERNPKAKLNLRMREAMGDVFAVVSPSYGEADAPAVMPAVTRALAGFPNVRATHSYDPSTTAWEIRAAVHTPTPTEEQAVGEAFEGYTSIHSRDNGTGRLNGGGGMLIYACLNAMVLIAGANRVSRVHRGKILVDLAHMVRQATKNIHALTEAWGLARLECIELPKKDDGALIPIQEAIPGFYSFMLTERRGDLVGVLSGRTATHAVELAKAYATERRNPDAVTRADLANGFTRYIQDQPAGVQQTAEVAIADWLVARRPVQFDAVRN